MTSVVAKKPRIALHRTIRHEFRKNWGLYLLVSIPVIWLIIFRYIPMYGVQIAFRDYTPVRTFSTSPWVGLANFRRFFTNPFAGNIIGNTLSISLYSLATFPLPIIFALLLNYSPVQRFKKSVQMVTYAPYFISTVVMAGMVLQFLDPRNGLVNIVLSGMGMDTINFMARADYFYHIFVWSGVWQMLGFNSIIFIAALSGVSPELHEAAIVDGATIMKRIWHVDLPSILPTVAILLILSSGTILSVSHERVLLLQNNLNLMNSEVISTFVFKQGLQAALPQYSYATAIGLFVSGVNVVILLIVNTITRKLSGSSLF